MSGFRPIPNERNSKRDDKGKVICHLLHSEIIYILMIFSLQEVQI